MSVINHLDYKQENEYLEFIIDYIEKVIGATEEHKRLYKENIKDAMINLDHLDSSQSYISILVNTRLIEMAEKNFDNLIKAKKKPYFARIDFKPDDSHKTDKIYIGKISLLRAEDNELLITDWRSPIANVYYEGRLGEVSYQSQAGEQRGELSLKRQYTIEEGKLEGIMDIDITTTDAFLQASLEANADNRLKDIASTIQGEQNRVIRAEMEVPLIVQGVAGSGKTTIALHRIAYFIYTYEKTFDPHNFMIIGPNKLFMNYISDVLPELGVEKVKQTTYIDYMDELIGSEFKSLRFDDKLMKIVSGGESKEIKDMMGLSSFKGSLEFKDIIEDYIKDIERSFVPREDFAVLEHTFMTWQEINKVFLEDISYLPLHRRIDEIKKNLSHKLKGAKKEILKDIEKYYDNRIQSLLNNHEPSDQRRQKVLELMEARENGLKKFKSQSSTAVKKFISKLPSKNKLVDYYTDLVTDQEKLEKYSKGLLSKEQILILCSHYKESLGNNTIELEDYAGILYLKHRLFGFEKKIEVRSVIIDEAQDFSLFQLYALRKVINTNMFTLLGDISQGIHSYRAIDNWDDVINRVFEGQRTNYHTLVQSYRTTIEIMDLANQVIKKLNNNKIVYAKPVIRHGEQPDIKEFKDIDKLIYNVEKKIKDMEKAQYKSIAIICKNIEECNQVKKYLDINNKIKAQILDEKQENYGAGVIIVPSHLAKGLEFDVVFIVNINEIYHEQELDIKLLYVAMTRTLHKLFVYSIEGTIEILK